MIRLIRMFVEFWDRVSVTEQELMFGRGGTRARRWTPTASSTSPDYAADPAGAVIPLDAHIRLANPRTPQTADQPDPAPRLQLRPGHDNVGATSTWA